MPMLTTTFEVHPTMKPCPCCGYEGTPTDRQILRLHKKHFGNLPVRAMIKRGWINVNDPLSLMELRGELRRFFDIKTDEELAEFLRDPVANTPYKIVRNGVPLN